MPKHRRSLMLLVLSLAVVVAGSLGVCAQETLVVQLIGLEASALKYIREQIVPAFEAEHGVKVEVEMAGWGDRMEKLLVRTAAGIPPDVHMNGAEHILELVRNGLAAPIDQEWYRWDEAEDFFPATLGSSTFQGVRYGVPLYTVPRNWWYRISLFEEAGLDSTQPPTTWDALLDAAKRLTRYEDNKVVQFGYALSRFNPGDQWSSIQDYVVYLWQAGGDLVDENTFAPLFNSQAGREALTFMLDLRDAVVGSATELAFDDWGNLAFSRGDAAIYLAGPWVPADMYSNFPDDVDDVAAFYELSGPGGAYNVVFSDWLGIHPESNKKDLAWRFIQEMTSSDALLGMHLQNGTLSPRRSTVGEYAAHLPLSRYMYESMEFGRAYPVFPNPDRVMSEWFNQYRQVLNRTIPVDEGLAEAARLWALWAE